MRGSKVPPDSEDASPGAGAPREAPGVPPAAGAFFDAAPFPYLVLSGKGLIVRANEAAADLLGDAPDRLIGWPLLQFVAPRSVQPYLDWLHRAARVAAARERLTLRRAGAELLAEVAAQRVPDGEGGHLLLAAIQDAGELQRAQQAVRDAAVLLERRVTERNQELEAANRALRDKIDECGRLELELRFRMQELGDAGRAKDEFLAMLAHELRNPLAPIRNAVEVLRLRGDGDRAVQWARGVMERQVEHLRRLVDDLLDVSRITRGKIDLHTAPLDLVEAVEQAVEVSEPNVAARSQRLAVRLPDAPLLVVGDRDRLVQAVANVLNNASKYTPPGGRIEIEASHDASEAWIGVRDTGQGIAPDLLPRIFEPFVQGERGLDRAQGGLGIGLTLVQRIVELHGGRVEARSAGPGCGAEFVLTLPAAGAAVRGGARQRAGEGRPAARRRVLVVDDNADAAETLLEVLAMEGHETRAAFDAESALRAAAEFRPDVLLLDIGLPDMDGRALAHVLRERPETRDALMIAVSGYGREEDLERSRAAGFDRHLVKPVDPIALNALIGRRSPPVRA